MKKTHFTELLKTINKTKVSFFSIAFFIMLGAGAFLGISWAIQGFETTVGKTLDQYRFEDIEIKHPYGLDDAYVDALTRLDDAYTAEGEYASYQYFMHHNSLVYAKVTSLTDKVNVITEYDGTLPQNNNECAVERYYAACNDIKIGDTLTFVHDDDGQAYRLNAIIHNDADRLINGEATGEDGMAYLVNDTFTVTALVDSPEHIGKYESHQSIATDGKQINVVIYVTKDTFDPDTVSGYSKVLLSCDSLRQYPFGAEAYTNANDRIIEQIKDFSSDYISSRNVQVVSNKESIGKQIGELIENGEKEIAQAAQQIADGEKEIAKAREDLANGRITLINARSEIDRQRGELERGIAAYEQAESIFLRVFKAYDTVKEALTVFSELSDNIQSIELKVQELKDLYLLAKTIAGYTLPDSYYAVSAVEGFFEQLNTDPAYRDKIGDYVALYNAFVCSIEENPAFPSRDAVNAELDLTIAGAVTEEDRNALLQFKEAINGFYDDFEMMAAMPSDLLALFDLIKGTPLLPMAEQEILQTIDLELSSHNIPTLKQIISELDGIIAAGYSTFDEIKPYVTAVFDYLNAFADKITVLESSLDPIVEAKKNELAQSKQLIDEAAVIIENAEKELAAGRDRYEEGLKEVSQKQMVIDEAKVSLTAAENKLAQSRDFLDDYAEATAALKAYDATINSRQTNFTLITADVVSEITSKLQLTLGALFVLVGIFVAFSAVSRMVYDQTVEIGTKKALGLRQREISAFYLLYALLASLTGSVLGAIVAFCVMEPVIMNVLADSYCISSFAYYFGITDFLLFTLFEMLVTLSAALFASRAILKRKAVQLLADSKQIAGKIRFYEKSAIWRKLPLLTKTIINNVFNDKRRVFGTIIGIAGCTTLLVCSLSFKNNIDASLSRQIRELSAFDTFINFDNAKESNEKGITAKLDDLGIEYTGALSNTGLLKTSDGSFVRVFLYTSNSDDLYRYRRQLSDGKEIVPTHGVIVSQSFCEKENIGLGDPITYVDFGGKEHTLIVEGTSENYMTCVDLYISKEQYEREFNSEIHNNTIFLKRNEKTLEEIREAVCSETGYISAIDYQSDVNERTRAITSTAMIIFIVFLVLSVLMALLVILNLLIVFVDEKKKETIILMINGYKKKYAKKYIYSDTIVLTIISIGIGSVLGSIAGIVATQTLNTNMTQFMTNIDPMTYILAAAITILLCAGCLLIALRKIDHYRLTEINKA